MASIGTTRDESGNVIETKYRRILTEIPAPGTHALLERLSAVEPRSMHGQLPIVWRDAIDYQVEDIAANRFIDFTSGIFVANVGHNNPAVWGALVKEAYTAPLHSYTYAIEVRLQYLEALTKWSGFDKAFLVCSGTEATETALRLMRAHGKNKGKRAGGVVCLSGAFHGRTMGAQFMGGKQIPSAFDLNIHHIDVGESFDDCIELLNHLDFDQDLCGFMIETFQGWSARFHPQSFVKDVERFCRKHDLLLCFDEMQAGFGRTGKKWGYEHYEVSPDLICVGKAMGGGFPLSGVLGRAEVMDSTSVGDMSSTHGGNPLACLAGLATLREIDRLDLVREAERKEQMILPYLCEIEGLTNQRVSFRGRGMIWALLVGHEHLAKRIVERCYRRGLLLVDTGRPSIKFGPPLTISDGALSEGMEVLRDAVLETW